MTARVEILNGHTSRSHIRVREVVVEPGGNGVISVRPIDETHDQSAQPGQRVTMHAGETKGRAILIEEIETK